MRTFALLAGGTRHEGEVKKNCVGCNEGESERMRKMQERPRQLSGTKRTSQIEDVLNPNIFDQENEVLTTEVPVRGYKRGSSDQR